MRKDKKFEFKSVITTEDIDNIMSSALNGMTHWCDEVKLRDEKDSHRITYLSEATARNIALVVHDLYADKNYVLTRKMFLRALGKVENHDFDSYDMLLADALVQTAIFGEPKYA